MFCFDSCSHIYFAAWIFVLKPGHVAVEFWGFLKEGLGPTAHKSLMCDVLRTSPLSRFSLGCRRFGCHCPHPAHQYLKADIVGNSHLILINFNFTTK